MTHILFVTRSLQREPGGMQTATRLLLHALKELPGIRLDVVGWQGAKRGLPLFFLRALLRSLFFRGHVVHFGDAAFAPVIACLRFLRPGLRVTCTAHGLDVCFPHPVYRFLLRGLRVCNAVVAVSSATARQVSALGVQENGIVIIPWGVHPTDLVTKTPGRPMLVSVGRQIPRKGTVWFLEHVFPRLLETMPDLRYTVVGDGPEMPKLRALIAAKTLETSVRLAGAVSDEQKGQILSCADVHLMPNVAVPGDMEGFGMACIEAAARGIPTVAARLEGIADAVVDNETGVFFQPGDAGHAAEVLHAALARHWDRAAVQQSCRRHYDIATVALRYANDVFAPAENRNAHGG